MYGRRRANPRFFLLLAAVVVGAVAFYFKPTTEAVISPIPEDPHVAKPVFVNPFVRKKNPADLKAKIQETIAGEWSNYSVYVVDFKSSFAMGINETVIYDGASVNKIPILAALYDYVQKGKVNLSETITPQPNDIQDYGTGSIRYDPPGTAYSIQTLARLMMQKSDNTAAYVLANHVVELSNIQSHVEGWGMAQTDMIDNKTSNKDIALLIKKIYDGQIADRARTAEMLAFLKDSDFENRLPPLLPEDAVVYHKIGTIEGGVHDAGIVVRGDTVYYIGIFTSDVTKVESAEKLIAKVSRVVFDYMD